MSGLELARFQEDVTEAWLTQALRQAGVLRDAKVIGLTTRRVGNGMFGDSVRFGITYDRAEDEAPASVVGKFASKDPVSRANGASVGLYETEINFYRSFRSSVDIRTPRPYVVDIDDATKEFTLILEDLTPARGGDQLTGCSIDDAVRAMDQAAALHGPRWGDPALLEIPWMNRRGDTNAFIQEGFKGYFGEFHARYCDMLEPEYMAECQRFSDQIGQYFAPRPTPPAPQHTDFRLDNMLFDAKGGSVPLAVLDWQSISTGSAMLDVAYFIGAGLLPDVRRQHEERLVRHYLDRLRGYGVTGYGWDTAWLHYRLGLLQGVFTAIFASVVTGRTERGDQMFMTMARRHCQHSIDLESLKALRAFAG
ncbi:MAG: phosphotransferase [Alphaproteobacteria bacterium]|nr:phosphotransferase [Alphaproteobacteria bacterium]